MKFTSLSALIECANGRTPTVEAMNTMIRRLAAMGYDRLYLGLTDAYKLPKRPYFNFRRGGYSTEDLKKMDACARENGIELVASIQTLGHLHYLARHESFRELMDTDCILMVGDERVYALVEEMLSAIREGLSSPVIHLGFDECWGLGTGNYLKKNGPEDKKELLLRHLKRVLALTDRMGYKAEIWHDMLMETDNTRVSAADVRRALPENVRVWFWDYFEKDEDNLRRDIDNVRAHAGSVGFAGSAIKCGSAAPLNAYSLARLIPQMKIAHEKGVASFMVTLWSDNGAWSENESVLPALFGAAEYARGAWDGIGKPDVERFKQLTGVSWDDLMLLDDLDDPCHTATADAHANRSLRLLWGDPLGAWDRLVDPGLEKAYASLAEKLEAAANENDEYRAIFASAAALARFLSVKLPLANEIRKAMEAKDETALRACIERAEKAAEALRAFTRAHQKAWLERSQPFGLEVDQLFLGYTETRLTYTAGRLTRFLETGEPVTELDDGGLLPDEAEKDEEKLWQADWRKILTNCGV